MVFDLTILEPNKPEYPSCLHDKSFFTPSPKIWAIGNPKILDLPLVGLFCSVKCPGDIILGTYDLARILRDAGVAVIGGFHSPIEKDCLDLLLRGTQPVVICPARNIEHMRIKKEFRRPLDEGRLLFLSPFGEIHRRPTVKISHCRNLFVAALSAVLFVAHAGPNSKTESICREALSWKKPIYTFDSNYNEHLIEMGARAITLDNVSDWAKFLTANPNQERL